MKRAAWPRSSTAGRAPSWKGRPRLARLGELSGVLLAAVAIVMPGIGPIVTAGPLSADLGEAAGQMGGGLVPVLAGAGVSEPEAAALEQAVRAGAVLLGVHARPDRVDEVKITLGRAGARTVTVSDWQDSE